jgi:hypothetical protein
VSEFFRYLRIYYERGSGNAVLDSGNGTKRVEVKNLRLKGDFTTEHAPEAPKFWLVARNAVVTYYHGIAYIDSESP